MIILVLGAAPPDKKLVARADSLSPPQIPSQPPESVVKTEVVNEPQKPAQSVSQPQGGGGYVMPGSNCVTCVKALTGRGQNGNAGTWKATSSVPSIGAIMIFRPGQQGAGSAGHVGVVTGINGNKISLVHCNFPNKTEFYSTGLFY